MLYMTHQRMKTRSAIKTLENKSNLPTHDHFLFKLFISVVSSISVWDVKNYSEVQNIYYFQCQALKAYSRRVSGWENEKSTIDVSCASPPALMSLVRASRLELEKKICSQSPPCGCYDLTTVLLNQRDVVHLGASVNC